MAPRRPATTLVVAVIMWSPSARALFAGDLSVDSAAGRLLLALGVAWIGVALLERVIAGYTAAGHAGVAAQEPAGEPQPRRRRTDQPE